MNELSKKNCIPCQGGVPPLEIEERVKHLKSLDEGWELTHEQNRLFRRFKFKDFKAPFILSCAISEMAEDQWHHPDLKFGWGYLEIEIYTHKIGSLVESDFIFAAKVDALARP